MAEYVPVHTPGVAVTLQASAAITAGQIVAVTGDGTVGPAGAASAAFVGVAAFDAADGDDVTIYSGGTQEVVASAAVAAGDLVVTAAGGEVATSATPAAGTLVGVAVTAAAAANDPVRVRFER